MYHYRNVSQVSAIQAGEQKKPQKTTATTQLDLHL